jgi:hypothetical protein
MKKLGVTFLTVLALAFGALPGVATARQITTVGPAFNIFTGHPTTFVAGAPFHYLLGWELPPGTDAVGKFSWSLDVDGTPRAADFTFHGPSSVYANGVARAWDFNFPGGMNAGTHTFTAHGFTPCYIAVSSFGYTGTCSTPNEVVEAVTLSMSVTFS